MHEDFEPTSQKQVSLIPTDRIRILNPRVRNRRAFAEMVENIARRSLNHAGRAASSRLMGPDPKALSACSK